MKEFERQKVGNILKKQGNKRCADCSSRAPSWASTGYGVLVCIRCAGRTVSLEGIHRELGVRNTFVRSADLDGMEKKYVEIYEKIDNERANGFWEKNIRATTMKPNNNTTNRELRNFIISKYMKRFWADDSRDDPVTQIKQTGRFDSDDDYTQEEIKPKDKPPKLISGPITSPKPAGTTPPPAAAPPPKQENLISMDDDDTGFTDFVSGSDTHQPVPVSSSNQPDLFKPTGFSPFTTPAAIPTQQPIQQQPIQQLPFQQQQPAFPTQPMQTFGQSKPPLPTYSQPTNIYGQQSFFPNQQYQQAQVKSTVPQQNPSLFGQSGQSFNLQGTMPQTSTMPSFNGQMAQKPAVPSTQNILSLYSQASSNLKSKQPDAHRYAALESMGNFHNHSHHQFYSNPNLFHGMPQSTFSAYGNPSVSHTAPRKSSFNSTGGVVQKKDPSKSFLAGEEFTLGDLMGGFGK